MEHVIMQTGDSSNRITERINKTRKQLPCTCTYSGQFFFNLSGQFVFSVYACVSNILAQVL
jgi:hypothetical protein